MNGGTINTANVWEAASSDSKIVHYVVRHPWEWIMEDLSKGLNMKAVEEESALPLAQLLLQQQSAQEAVPDIHSDGDPFGTPGTPFSSGTAFGTPFLNTPRRRRAPRGRPKSSQGRASLRLEVVDVASGQVELAVHGTSACFEGLGDKDELVRTMQRCRCENMHLTPPSILIQWDVSKEECHNILKETLPVINGAPPSAVAVLKEPMGSQGRGIYFVRNADEIYDIIYANHKRASDDPSYLDKLISVNGRIPSWVLQAEVAPSLMIKQRKFHIRTYVLVRERTDDEVLDMYLYNRHEVRLASVTVDKNEGKDRNPLAHITNGSLSESSKRMLLSEVPELVEADLQPKVELFVAELFGKWLLPDISRRIPPPPQEPPAQGVHVNEFSVAGLDLMVTEDLRLFLLEVNVNPAAPRPNLCSETYCEHLKGFFKDLVNIVTVGVAPNFIDVFEILERHASESSV